MRWLRQMISLASRVCFQEREAAPAAKLCPQHPEAGLHSPRWHKIENPHLGAPGGPPSARAPGTRSGRHRSQRLVTGMADGNVRASRDFQLARATRPPGQGSPACRPSQCPTRPQEPWDQPGGESKASVRRRAGGPKPAPEARTPCRPASRTHRRDQSPRDARLQLRTAQPRRWMATGDGHGRGPQGSRSLVLFLAPAMLARMRRDAAGRLDFP